MVKLTVRQAQVLEFIKNQVKETGMPPTRVEIACQLGFRSANAAEEHLKALARKGQIEIIPGISRGIRLMESEALGIPVVGKVAAGQPILAQEHIDNYCKLDPSYFTPSADYLLKVQGMSMKNAGIIDGDLVAVHRVVQVRNKQIVIARIDDEVTIKRFENSKNGVILHAENESYEPILVNPQQDFFIEGLCVGVIRKV